MKSTYLQLLLVWGLSCVNQRASAVVPAGRLEFSEYGFSITIPDGWVQTDSRYLDALNAAMQKRHPDWPMPVAHMGFQSTPGASASAKIWIRVNEMGRPSALSEVRQEVKVWSSQGGKLKGPHYDPQVNAFLSEGTVGGGKESLATATAIIPTKRGSLKLMFYTPEGESSLFRPVFDQFVKNVSVLPELEYHPSPVSPWIFIITASVGLTLGGIGFLVRERLGKKTVSVPVERPEELPLAR